MNLLFAPEFTTLLWNWFVVPFIIFKTRLSVFALEFIEIVSPGPPGEIFNLGLLSEIYFCWGL